MSLFYNNPFINETQREQAVKEAAAAIRTRQSLPESEQQSQHAIADRYGVPLSTVQNRLSGVVSKAQSNAAKAHFSTAESNLVVELILYMAERGFPLTKDRLEELANIILLAKHCGMGSLSEIIDTDALFTVNSELAATAPVVGKNWAKRWLLDYSDKIKEYKARHLDSVRANALNPASGKRSKALSSL
ncbi:3540_t:CDS:1 [Acaulospora colombiana]|uniref:3540_t:CDS:1 n=1 Tax=Acaulospora colombiana TaxID=27376 RepID=A0ACA9Q1W9_9GLOM|nr:3540_t:CDS:1 [Acaulospora colombiana]